MTDYRRFSLLTVSVISFSLLALSADAQTFRLVRAHSGSDFEVQRVDGRGPIERVQLWGVEAPVRGQPFWQQSRDSAVSLLRRPFRIVRVKQLYTVPLVVILAQDGRGGEFNFIHRMLSAGNVWWHRFRHEYARDLEALEEQARLNRRGLWRADEPIAPWQWREDQRPRR